MFFNNPKHVARAYYCLFFAALGAILPYLGIYYLQINLATYQIGILAALLTAISLVASPFWSFIADRFQLHQKLLPALILMTIPTMLLIGRTQEFEKLIILITLFAGCLAPINPMADYAVLKMLGERKKEYGRLRLWGSIGFAVVALLVGSVIEVVGLEAGFAVFAVLMTLCAVASIGLPITKLRNVEPFWVAIQRLTGYRRLWGFFLSILLFGTGLSMVGNYLVLYLKELGIGEGVYGIVLFAGAGSELPVLLIAPLLLRWFSVRQMITFAFAGMTLRCLMYGFTTDPTMLVAIQLIQGITFGTLIAFGASYVSEMSPDSLGASTQALYGVVLSGLSGLIGALLGSELYELIGPVALFQVAGAVIFSGLIVFVCNEWDIVVFKRKRPLKLAGARR